MPRLSLLPSVGSRTQPIAPPARRSAPPTTIFEENKAAPKQQPLLSISPATITTFSTMVEASNQDLNSTIITLSGRLDKLVALSRRCRDAARTAALQPMIDSARNGIASAIEARNAIDAANTSIIVASTTIIDLSSSTNLLAAQINDALASIETHLEPFNVDITPNKDKALPPLPKIIVVAPESGPLSARLDVQSPTAIVDDELRRNVRYGCGPQLRQAIDAREVIMGFGDERDEVPAAPRLRMVQSMSSLSRGAVRRVRKRVSGLFAREL